MDGRACLLPWGLDHGKSLKERLRLEDGCEWGWEMLKIGDRMSFAKRNLRPETTVVLIDGQNLYQSWINLLGKRELDIEFLKDWIVTHIGRVRVGRYFIHIGVPGAPKFDEFLESIGLPAVRTVNIDVHTSLVAEGIEILFQVDFSTLVLIAGDNNYIPLLKKYRLHGKSVVVLFFPEATGRWLRSQCDEFINLADLLPEEEHAEQPDLGP